MNNIKVLLIEASPEMEMGISPTVAILVAGVKSGGFDVDVFSTNEYRHGAVTGDEARINTLQVPPVISNKIYIEPKKSDRYRIF